ncbi:HTH-type transcriptional repressor AllR [Kibdelosporangium sp. 4NS15]|uniref:HTH-type transcriptional repressor AllR n=1 Tax=Kibdelosporangium persicum TaxID=2698649 RepID=A0ABX2FAI7_9PSEU|nr:IclR family transcriptional regulator [Kibdelosporangium persicum]NRN67940.1 HTH-type transcriptional repressor AllR [Kibdelosporangium persicum]
MRNKPVYSIDSVDHALRLAVLLRQEGPLRVTEAAQRLGVARSTAHRLLAMLVYREFAVQDEDRRYVAGPVLRPVAEEPVVNLREVALPHLRELVRRCGETVNLTVLDGADVRFVASVECDRVLRVGDREGRLLPARLTSGGLAILGARDEEDLTPFCAEDTDLPVVRRAVRKVRREGFAINDQRTEAGVTAVGRALRDAAGKPVAAVSIAMPTARYDRTRLPEWVALLTATASAIERTLGLDTTQGGR